MHKKLSAILLIFMTSCAMQTQLNIADYDQYRKEGNNSISGQAFLKQKGGTVVTCAGNPVRLSPDTEYFREYWAIVKTKRTPIEPERNVGKRPVSRKTQCDAQGNFSYENIPDGTWILSTYVQWEVARSGQGGVLTKTIELSGGKPIESIADR